MYTGKLIFSQVVEHIPLLAFHRSVNRYRRNYKIKDFTCLDQYLCIAFAQLTYRESLRDIESCLRSQRSKLYHMGIRGIVSRNTLANANKVRDWRIYADFAHCLIQKARVLYLAEDFGVQLDQTVYALDATTIDLCLSVFPWVHFRQTKAAVKLHTFTGSSRQHSNVHSYKRWQATRCKYPGFSCYRARSVLHNGPRISGFCQTVYVAFEQGILRHPGQVQFQISQTAFPSCRSDNGAYLRSKRYAHRLLFSLSLSGENPQDQISRRRLGQDSDISYQQFHASSNDDSSTISLPMAGGTLFQVDKTEPQNQEFLRDKRQCSQNSGLDRCIDICCGGDHKGTSQITGKSLYDSTDIERDHV